MENKHKGLGFNVGCGGLVLGLEKVGFTHIGLVDADSDACMSLSANFPNSKVYNMDVETFSEQDVCNVLNVDSKELSLIAGSLPYICDDKNIETFVSSYSKCLGKLKPKMFVLETVKELLFHSKGETFRYVNNVLQDCGYNVKYKLLNANDYLVAQERFHLFIVGVREDVKSYFTFPKSLLPKYDLDWVLVDDSYGVDYENKKETLEKTLWNKPCPSLLPLAQGDINIVSYPNIIYPISVSKIKTIQSFPQDYTICGTVHSQIKQLCNTVPPNLAREIGEELTKCLNKQ